jgi:sulfite exporter TauE/SafE
MLALVASSFALGLATSVHCISMCGPMVVTYAVRCGDDAGWRGKVAPNITYQGAKIVSYTAVGVVLGAIGAVFNFDSIRPWVIVAAGLFMVVLGLGMTGHAPWAARLTPRPPKALVTALTRLRRKAKADATAEESSLAVPAAFGLLTGLMPCAPLQAAQLVAASSGNAVAGGLTMMAFGVGTAPLMLAFGTTSSLVPKAWKERLHVALAAVVIISGLVFLNRAALLTGFPLNTRTIVGVFSEQSVAQPMPDYARAPDGTVEVPLVIQSIEYFPASIIVPSDQPARLIVDRREDDYCSDRLVIPRMGVDVALAPNGTTVVVLPPCEPGTYPMTCGMGMMSGEIIVRAP